MKILVVNNHTQHLKHLNSALLGHQLEIVMYRPGVTFYHKDKDLIILSGGGGEGLEINDAATGGKLWYEDQMNFILSCNKPILGICMGFEVIARAYGSKVEEMKDLIMGFQNIKTTAKGKAELGKDEVEQYEAHKWRVQKINEKEFDILADSRTGIEIIKHKKRKILATQFHPEKGGTLSVGHLMATLKA
jgi:GMP synthase-like glutamine amidotransferase